MRRPRRWDARVQPEIIDARTGEARSICVDCGEAFERDPQDVAARRGTGLPVSPRCPPCRVARREEHNTRVLATLRTGQLQGTRPAAVGPADGAERLYGAVCSDCRRPIRLPFKPRLDRPVYCRFCRDTRSGR
jgi:CxxC-x17-CxxC domain-containing protein